MGVGDEVAVRVPLRVAQGAVGVGREVLAFVEPLKPPIDKVGVVAGAWYAIGAVYLAWIRARTPERLAALAEIA